MLEKELETNTGSSEEGLRLLARIIARIYIRDAQNKTAMGDQKQLQKEQRKSGKAA